MKVQPESILKRQICEYLDRFHSHHCYFWVQESVGVYDSKRGVWRRKNSPWQRRGISDICGIYRGVPMFLEVKIPTSNRVSEDQKKFLKAVKERGSIAAVVKSIDDVIKVLKEADGLMTDRGYLGK